MEPKLKNRHDSRDRWCRSEKVALEPHFDKHGYTLPDNIRFAIAFTSYGRKGKAVGQTLFPDASSDGHFEIIVRCDIDDPIEVAGVIMHQLIHVVTGPKHDAKFREACLRLGMDVSQGLRHARPGKVLREERLNDIVAQLGPLPHGRIDLDALARAADRPRKQAARLLKAECVADGCGYLVRVTDKWLRVGAPHCPLHGAMKPEEDISEPLPAAASLAA